MSSLKQAVIVIPIYKGTISTLESIALLQAKKILSGYPIIAIKPLSLVLPVQIASYGFTAIISFDDHYFKDVQGYNELMLSNVFYKEFLAYEYMLIHQLDAFVFANELDYWCKQQYDYIGAPWIYPHDYPNFIKALTAKFKGYVHRRYNILRGGLPSLKQFENQVGNGGLSLRRVKKFHDLSIALHDSKAAYLSHNEHHFNEDNFWSIEVNRKRKVLNIPSYKKALKFSVENFPDRAFKLSHGHMPFGCHAWDKHLDFWRPVFEKYGYTI